MAIDPQGEDLDRSSLLPTTTEPLDGKTDAPSPPVGPGANGQDSMSWLTLAGAIGGLAGATAIVYAVGGAVMLMRLDAAGVEADQALGAIPQQTLFAVGAEQLLLPAFLAAGLYFLFFFVERRRLRRATEDRPQTDPPPPAPTKSPPDDNKPRFRRLRIVLPLIGRVLSRLWRSLIGRAVRRLLRFVLAPVKWYFRYVPDVLLAWLPVLIFLPNPGQTVMNAIAATGGAAIPEWAEQTSRGPRDFAVRSALAFAVLIAGVGLGSEWIYPNELPKVTIRASDGRRQSAQFVAVSGGTAYVVDHSRLAILPSSSYQRLTVVGSDTEDPHEESIFERLRP